MNLKETCCRLLIGVAHQRADAKQISLSEVNWMIDFGGESPQAISSLYLFKTAVEATHQIMKRESGVQAEIKSCFSL
jgi:hypothetical protein